MAKNTTAAIFLILGTLALGAKQERDRLWDWFDGLDWFWQGLVGTVVVLFFMFTLAWVAMPFIKQWVK